MSFAVPTLARLRRPITPSPGWRALGLLALAGPFVFALVSQGAVLLPADPVAGAPRAMQAGARIAFGAGVVALARLLWRAAGDGPVTRSGVVLLAIAGVALIAEAAPLDASPPATGLGKLHFTAVVVRAFACVGAALAIGVGLLDEPRWSRRGIHALAAAALSVTLALAGPWSVPEAVARHGAWEDPLGRAHFLVWATWCLLMGRKAGSILREGPA